MKRLSSLLVVGLLALTLVRCGGGATSTPVSEPAEPTAPPVKTEPPPPPTEALPAAPKILRVAATASVTTWDPSSSFSTEALYMANLYETLVQIKPDGTFEPALAESYDVSDDGLVWIFHLREGVTFHDGGALTAEVVKASIERTRELGTGASWIWPWVSLSNSPPGSDRDDYRTRCRILESADPYSK